MIYYIVYKEQPDGTYFVDDSAYLTGTAANGATPAGDDSYWDTDCPDALAIMPGESVSISFDESMAKDKSVIYALYAQISGEDAAMYPIHAFVIVGTVAGFTDVSASAYYADAVAWAVENNVTSGTSKTNFSPSSCVTRAQAVTFLWRAYGSPEPTTTTSPFTDVTDESAYYYKAVLWAAENGITTGTSSTRFGLDGTLSYDQILTFLCRAAGGDASGSDWSAKAIQWAKDNGATTNLTFSAKDNCPRSDVVYFLYNQLG
jgi:hypothetical protein